MFVKLTEKLDDPKRLQPVFINPAQMQCLQWENDKQRTAIETIGGSIYVAETPEEIIDLIRECSVAWTALALDIADERVRGTVVINPLYDDSVKT